MFCIPRLAPGACTLTRTLATVVCLLYMPHTGKAAELSPTEARGKQIFLIGSSASGREITARVGQASIPVPAGTLPCSNCHGRDGLGRPEGGVTPTDITWSRLTKSYGTVSGSGERRPAYNAGTLARAITTGFDSAGERLDSSMPRFQMDAADMADLIAYLKRLEHDLDPGLTDSEITVGTVLPQGGPSAPLGDAIRRVVTAYFDDINAQGGIYSRRLVLKVAGAPTRDLVLERAQALIERGEVFALVAAVTGGLESELGKLVQQHEIPLIGPFTQFPGKADTLQRFSFYLVGGLEIQGKALVDYAEKRLALGAPRIGVVYPRDGRARAVARAIRQQAEKHRWPPPLLIDYPPRQMNTAQIVTALTDADAEALFFLGPGSDLVALGAEGARRNWVPYVLMAGSSAGKALFELPPDFQGRVFLAYSTMPPDHNAAGARAFRAFHRRHGLPRHYLPEQVSAYAAAKLLVEGLKSSGRSLSREKLVQALEALRQFETGLTPPLTYGPNRHIGAQGAYVVALDLEKRAIRPGGQWVAPQ